MNIIYLDFKSKIEELYIKKVDGLDCEYKCKSYLHFDKTPLPKKLNEKPENSAELQSKIKLLYDKISDKNFFTGKNGYSFLPLIRVEKTERKFKPKKNNHRQKRPTKIKIRPLTYCSNFEKIIYIYYNQILEKLYEQKLRELGLENNILAYRKIEKSNIDGEIKNKCNIDFALDSFKQIKFFLENKGYCTAIALDISGFFDNISHKTILQEWCSLFPETNKIPDDHFRIYKAITKFCFIRKNILLKKIYALKSRKSQQKTIYGWSTKIEKQDFLKLPKSEQSKYGTLRICKLNENIKIKDVIKACKTYQNEHESSSIKPAFKSNKNDYGIPQGLPLSGVISNISFISLDLKIKEICNTYNAEYFRYCDDILLILPSNNNVHADTLKEAVKNTVEKEKRGMNESEVYEEQLRTLFSTKTLATIPYLKINESKTEMIYFKKENSKIISETLKKGEFVYKPLVYLGIQFDGKNIRLKSSKISKQKTKNKYLKIRIQNLYKNYTISTIKRKIFQKQKGYIKYVKKLGRETNDLKVIINQISSIC